MNHVRSASNRKAPVVRRQSATKRVNFKMVRQDFSIFCCKFPLSHLNHILLRFMYFFCSIHPQANQTAQI